MMSSSRSQVVHINSANRTSGTVNDFTVDLGNRLFAVDQDMGKIRVCPVQVVVNRSWYTIASGINDRFDLFDGTTLTTVVMPEGYYNYKTLQAALQSLLVGWAVVWSLFQNKYTLTPPNDQTTYTLFWTTPACELLGFNLGSQNTVSFGSPLTSLKPIRMNRESVVLVHANFPKERFSAVDNVLTNTMRESNIFIKIPVDKPPFDNLVWRVNDLDINSFYLNTTSLSSVRFFLTDENNRSLVPAYDWTMTIRVDHFDARTKIDDMKVSVDRIRDYLRYLILSPSNPSDQNKKSAPLLKHIKRK